ncbi:MAG TPA: NAD(P)-dependent oxidoreductase [Bryobacteraceae bacterium]|nr:NAD(P)-dependent oxidoreductase [Bryobacteraceae bacterium]
MRIFLAGATGAIGKQLIPMLVAAGHSVTGMTRTAAKSASLEAMGVEPVVADALNREEVVAAVIRARPQVVVHELTAIGKMRDLRHFDREFEMTNRLRTEGTRNLLAGAVESGAAQFIAQSFTGWPNQRTGGRVKSEEDPLDSHPPKEMEQTMKAIRELESLVLDARALVGTVLRYGGFYGPGTSLGAGGDTVETIRKRMFPIFGAGAGVWSFLQIEDAARATHLAIERGTPGIFNIVDDEPAEVAVWLPYLARAIGAKAPLHLPAWVGRLMMGEAGLALMNSIRGSSNGKAKRVLGWTPRYASWRDGFQNGLGIR